MAAIKGTSFKNFVLLQRGFDLPEHRRIMGTFPVIASTSIQGYHAEFKVKPPGVVTGRSGALGKVLYISEPFWPLNTTLWVKDFKGNNPQYVYYYLQTIGLERYNSGAGVPTLNRNHLDEIEVFIHDHLSQRKIAAILSAYDDLIETNLRRIKILEEIARTTYDEWFVKFHFPGHEKVKMVESELGLIPEGWEVKKVEELIEYHIGGGWGKELPDTKHTSFAYVIRGTDIPDAKYGGVDNIPLRVHSESNLKSRILQTNDIVFEVSGGSKDQPVGRALLINQNLSRQFDKKVMCASFCKLLRPRSIVLPELLFLHFQTIYDNRKIMQYQVQSTGITNFKFEYFLQNEPVLTPKKEVQDRFANIIGSIFDAIQLCGIRNTNLRKTRDFLLPKLITGEIDVENLDIQIGGSDEPDI